ncbi:catechol 2,3-dioxygenase-like lactoylglutathione lyase family enzyme [Aequitasia blattaphilus]|uniref:VOC family protein n=1 Tax=Aequitasia blattaphilus TaxID=2949332 RepID=A0ABT1EFU3_9FIRM|nr:VOC family protein [Aequitasia blattaphilus]MCP1103327.1 VOC family protein [Aequitasia blattaphilus]MCR8615967.1 VOC family protein [Aequitasia blattaphilus]
MKYKGVCIAVKDVNLSKAFYQELFGFKVYQDYGINVSFGEISLQQEFDWLIDKPKESVLNKSHNMELYFEEDAFDEFIEKLEKRSDITCLDEGVKEAPWGQRSIKFYDPDGHIIEVGENMKAVINRFLCIGMTMEQVSKHMDVSISDLEKLLCDN